MIRIPDRSIQDDMILTFDLSPIIMKMEKGLFLKGNDPIGDTPIFR